MRPLDPRLLRHARTTRVYIAVSVALGTATAGLIIAQATLLADMITRAFLGGAPLAALRTPMLLLLAVVAGRALVVWAQEVAAHRSSAEVKSQLRERLLGHAVRLGSAARSGELATVATRGVDALDGYFARYLPQLVLAVVVPLTVGLRILLGDWLSALTIGLTLPLIPVFAILVGLTTRTRMDRRWRTLTRLAGHFLDVVAGLPTLKVFGRAKAQARTIREITDRHRRATMATLRVAFLSALVLEFLATVSVALVAVSIGLRLVNGEIGLRTALLVLILAPEAYLPLRQVGAQYHASVEGLSAATRIFEVLETPAPEPGTRTLVSARPVIRLEGVTVRYDDRDASAVEDLSLTVHPGETLALTGPSGAGKSTLLAVLLGFVRPTSGRVLVGGTDLAGLDPDAWRARVAWLPQRPYLFADTVAANIRLGRTDATDADVRRAARAAGALDLVTALPQGFETPIGEGGTGLSAGQRQRVALARVFLRDAPLVLLDEPTAGLDAESEAAVIEAIGRLAEDRTVVLVAHRPALAALADRRVRIEPVGVAA
jgi:thiol reductant ABC exporter CydD subunit